jgi:hypothetical protein
MLELKQVCSNEKCREPRFTHKRNLRLLDNILLSTDSAGDTAYRMEEVEGATRVDISNGFSDHGVVTAVLRVSRVTDGLADSLSISR